MTPYSILILFVVSIILLNKYSKLSGDKFLIQSVYNREKKTTAHIFVITLLYNNKFINRNKVISTLILKVTPTHALSQKFSAKSNVFNLLLLLPVKIAPAAGWNILYSRLRLALNFYCLYRYIPYSLIYVFFSRIFARNDSGYMRKGE